MLCEGVASPCCLIGERAGERFKFNRENTGLLAMRVRKQVEVETEVEVFIGIDDVLAELQSEADLSPDFVNVRTGAMVSAMRIVGEIGPDTLAAWLAASSSEGSTKARLETLAKMLAQLMPVVEWLKAHAVAGEQPSALIPVVVPESRFQAIAKDVGAWLFSNGSGDAAYRLVLMANDRNLGGWCRSSVERVVVEALRRDVVEALRRDVAGVQTSEVQ